jgi:hypothetical protein
MHPFAKWHRLYMTAKLAAVSIPRILSGLVLWVMALFALMVGLLCIDWGGDLVSVGNGIAAICFLSVIGFLFNGAERVFEALPGITPRWINDAGGSSRLATRKEKKRGGVI